MDEDALGAALRRATDGVEVPRDLVRQAQRLGRVRRARRRSSVAALAVAVVVAVGGGLVVTSQQGRGSDASGSSSAAGSSAAEGSASAESAPVPAPEAPEAPEAMQDAIPSDGDQSATCAPTLVVGGVPQGESGAAAPVRAGEVVDVSSGPLSCGVVVPGARYDLVLTSGAAAEPVVLTGVTVADDGSFAVRVTVPASTPRGAAVLSVTASSAAACLDDAGCEAPDYRADLDVRPARVSPSTVGP